MLRHLAYILVAIIATTGVAFGQECVNPAAMAMQAVSSVPNASIKEMLKDDEARVILDAYNAIEPVSDFKADFIATIQAPSVPVYLVIAYTASNCVVWTHTWERQAYDQLRKSGV
jgi:hypothetical protein